MHNHAEDDNEIRSVDEPHPDPYIRFGMAAVRAAERSRFPEELETWLRWCQQDDDDPEHECNEFCDPDNHYWTPDDRRPRNRTTSTGVIHNDGGTTPPQERGDKDE